jgi:hypothetical protein
VLLVTLHGKCWLKVEGKELPCIPKLLNSNYPSGRTGFYIVGADDSTYTWSGAAGSKLDAGSQILQVDKFIMTVNGKTSGGSAKGSCQYQNPYLGKPTNLTCNATYGKRVTEFRFQHDGSPPIEDKLPAP